MAQTSTIEWTDTTWNPVVGCRKVSAGCKFCYAERMSARLASMATSAEHKSGVSSAGRKANYKKVVGKNRRWTGSVELVEAALGDPEKWRSPRTVFVNSMSDLFHEDVPLEFIQRVFAVMNNQPQHTFQVLTKRPERTAALDSKLSWTKNIWMGTSVEDERVVDRIEELRKVSAKVRFLSLEPLLGPLENLRLESIHWVIVGGESGPRARPMKTEWVENLRDQCLEAEVPFFFKQWGGKNKKATGRVLEGKTWDQMPQPSLERIRLVA
jgi:protein gp37